MSRSRKKADLLDALFAQTRQDAVKRAAATKHADKALQLRTLLMPSQVRLEADMARRIAVRSPRRTGKSTGVLLIVTIRCLEHAAAEWVVVGLTRPSVERIYWSALKQLNEAFELGIKFQHQKLIAEFPNGSKISFTGAENIGEIEKLRGGKYDGVVIDECKSFGAHVFTELVYDVLEPALLDREGQLFVIGTPGDILAGPFFLATCEEPVRRPHKDGTDRYSNWPVGSSCPGIAEWSLHRWTLKDNTTIFRAPRTGREFTLWDEALALKAQRGWADDHPTWRREYEGHWVANLLKQVWRYRPHIHDYDPLADTLWGIPEIKGPDGKPIPWKSCIGVDPGTRDGTGMVVWAWHPHTQHMYEVYSERRSVKGPRDRNRKLTERETSEVDRLSVSVLARWYKELEEKFGPFEGSVSDPAGLATMVMDSLAEEGVYLEVAEKIEKLDHIELFNNDLDAGFVHVRRGSDLSEDLLNGRWDAKKLDKGKLVEDDAVPNDVSDAGLYGWRWCNHRRATPVPDRHEMFTARWYRDQAAIELAELRKRTERPAENMDSDWWSTHEPRYLG